MFFIDFAGRKGLLLRSWGLRWTLFGAYWGQDCVKRGLDGDKTVQVGAKMGKMRPRRSKKEAKRKQQGAKKGQGGGQRTQNGARWRQIGRKWRRRGRQRRFWEAKWEAKPMRYAGPAEGRRSSRWQWGRQS